MTLIELKKAVKLVERLGFKKYSPSPLQGCDRFYQLVTKDNNYIGLLYYDHSMYAIKAPPAVEIEVYNDGECAIMCKYYSIQSYESFESILNKIIKAETYENTEE